MEHRRNSRGRDFVKSTRKRRQSIRAAAYSVFGIVLFVSLSVFTYFAVFSFSNEDGAALNRRDERNVKANAGILEMIVNGLLASYAKSTKAPPSAGKVSPQPKPVLNNTENTDKTTDNATSTSTGDNSEEKLDAVLNAIIDDMKHDQTSSPTPASTYQTAPPTTSQSPMTSLTSTQEIWTPPMTTVSALAQSPPLYGHQDENVTTSDCTKHDFVIDKLCVLPYQIVQMQMRNIQYMGLLRSVCDKRLCNFWKNCSEARWCDPNEEMKQIAYDMAVRWTNGNYEAQICPLQQCLRQVTQKVGCTSPARVYMVEASELMCDMSFAMKNEPDLVCAASAIFMINMDLGNLQRKHPIEMKGFCDYPRYGASVCKRESCRVYYSKMACLAQLCGSHRSAMTMFPQWSWFFIYYDEIMRFCEIPKTSCTPSDIIEDPDENRRKTAKEKVEKKKNFYIHYITAHYASDKRVVAGIILAGIVGCSAVILIVLALFRRLRRSRQYQRDFVNYSEVRGLVGSEST